MIRPLRRTLVVACLVMCSLTAVAQTHRAQPDSARSDGARTASDVLREAQRRAVRRHIDRILEEKLHAHRASGPRGDGAPSLHQRGAGVEMQLGDRPEREGEIHAVVNPADSNNIVVGSIRSTGPNSFTLPIYFTRDFGRTWETSQAVQGDLGGGDPVFAADRKGTIYYSWIEIEDLGRGESREGIYWSRSLDGGATWSPTSTLAEGGYTITPYQLAGHLVDKQWLAVDRSGGPRDGAVYAAFVDISFEQANLPMTIVARRMESGTDRFVDTSVAVSSQEFVEVQFSSIGVDHEGRVHVFFWGSDMSIGQALWHAYSDDGARSFSAPTPVAPVRFPETQSIPSHLPQRLACFPQFAVDGDPASPHRGNLYAVWTSNDLASGDEPSLEEPLHIYFTRSADRGATWSAPVRMNDDTPGFRADHFQASIDVSPKGSVVVTWYDGRATEANRDVDQYVAVSSDGGATFGPNTIVSGAPSNIHASLHGRFGIGDYTKVISTAGHAIPIWSDGRTNDGDLNVYIAFVPIDQPSSAVRTVGLTSLHASVRPSAVADRAVVRLTLDRAADVRVELIDLAGTIVRSLSERREAGDATLTLDCTDLPAARYLYRVAAGELVSTGSVDVVR